MPRIDLLALSHQDLEMMSNRGTVKRSQRELDENEVQFEITEDATGNVTVQWSEGVTTKLPVEKVLRDCPCSCVAIGICRHIVRSVLAYQKLRNSATVPPEQTVKTVETLDTESSEAITENSIAEAVADLPKDSFPSPPEPDVPFTITPWDPGSISDEEIERAVGTALFSRASKIFQERHIIELTRGIKPFAKFHTLAHSVRFLVPFDIRYARCDCAAAQLCIHVPLAIMAFRRMAPERAAGLVVTAKAMVSAQSDEISKIRQMLFKLTAGGIAHINMSLTAEIKRACETCLNEELIWPAEMLADVILEIERYKERDARYSASHAMQLIAELFIRFAVIKNQSEKDEPSSNDTIPIEFVKGLQSDQPTDVASTRLVGLGCGGSISRFGSSLVAYMQDLNNGNLVTVKKDFIEKQGENWRSLSVLSEKPALKALGLGALGKGQILTKGGKLTRSREYEPGRAQFTFNHQSYQWEQLRPPLLVETFAELRAVLSSRFPAYVAPRYSGRDFYVCKISQTVNAKFSEMDQAIKAVLIDREGEAAELYSPYFSIAAHGCARLLHYLNQPTESLLFVAGHVRPGRKGLVINPTAAVFDDGKKRTMVQPWVDKHTTDRAYADQTSATQAPGQHGHSFDPLMEYLGRMMEELGDLLTNGFERIDSRSISLWQTLAQEADSVGFSIIAAEVKKLADLLASKPGKINWNSENAAHVAIDLAVLVLVAQSEVYGLLDTVD